MHGSDLECRGSSREVGLHGFAVTTPRSIEHNQRWDLVSFLQKLFQTWWIQVVHGICFNIFQNWLHSYLKNSSFESVS
jgi:hypothetical protein